MRARVSELPPATNGTMILMLRSGQADAAVETSDAKGTKAITANIRQRIPSPIIAEAAISKASLRATPA
jgi:hypothetical protein